MEKVRDIINKISTELIAWFCLFLGFFFCSFVFFPFFENVDVKALFLGIGCSLIASSLVLLLTARYTIRRRIVVELTERWGITGIYETRQEMNSDSNIKLRKMTRRLDVIAWGLSSFRNIHDDLVRERVRNGLAVRILCPHPDSQDVKRRTVEESSQEGQIQKNILDLVLWVKSIQRDSANKGNIDIRFYDALPHEHYMRVDDNIYIGPYHYDKLSQLTISFSFGYGAMYKYYTNYFDKLWNNEEFLHNPDVRRVNEG